MSVFERIKRLFGDDSDSTRLFECQGCSNLFTRSSDTEVSAVSCPNCGASEIELAAEAS